jgi:effector-binding domain-containing protein
MAAEQRSDEVSLLTRDPQPVVSIRATIPVAQLGEVVGERLGALGAYLQRHGLTPAGPPFVRYHTFGNTETDMEVGVPVAAPAPGDGSVHAGTLPGGPAITTWHRGPHTALGDAYARLAAWQQAHDRAPAGPTWEVYHWIDLSQDSPRDPDFTTWHTQLIQPLQ